MNTSGQIRSWKPGKLRTSEWTLIKESLWLQGLFHTGKYVLCFRGSVDHAESGINLKSEKETLTGITAAEIWLSQPLPLESRLDFSQMIGSCSVCLTETLGCAFKMKLHRTPTTFWNKVSVVLCWTWISKWIFWPCYFNEWRIAIISQLTTLSCIKDVLVAIGKGFGDLKNLYNICKCVDLCLIVCL